MCATLSPPDHKSRRRTHIIYGDLEPELTGTTAALELLSTSTATHQMSPLLGLRTRIERRLSEQGLARAECIRYIVDHVVAVNPPPASRTRFASPARVHREADIGKRSGTVNYLVSACR